MSLPELPDRREFLRRLGAVGLASQLPIFLSTMNWACSPEAAASEWRTFSATEAQDVEAICARIIPSGDTPGAREANVVRFMDAALQEVQLVRGGEVLVREGLTDLLNRAEGRRFSELSESEQDRLIGETEDTPYFGLIQFLTIAGFLCHPNQGGNQGKVGWAHIGFDDRHAWQPPFGYYDAQEGA